jgi:hypothetical protein
MTIPREFARTWGHISADYATSHELVKGQKIQRLQEEDIDQESLGCTSLGNPHQPGERSFHLPSIVSRKH